MSAFKILRRDNDHVLMQSETRPELSHSLEKVDGEWTCTCEFAQFNKAERCKHIKHISAQELIREASPDYLTKK